MRLGALPRPVGVRDLVNLLAGEHQYKIVMSSGLKGKLEDECPAAMAVGLVGGGLATRPCQIGIAAAPPSLRHQ